MLGLLLVWQVALCEEPAGDAPTQGTVTEEIIEAKIQEVESSSAAEGQPDANLVALYRKALSNLRTAASNSAAADAFARASQTAPVQMQAIEHEMNAPNPTDVRRSF